MAFKSYANEITVEDVSLALEHLLVAPQGTAWTPGRVDVSSPPAGFLHMGAVQEDSPQLQIQKEQFQLQTGVPRVLQYQAVIGMTGNFQMVFHSARNSRLFHTLGGAKPYHVANTAATNWNAINSVVSRFEVIVASDAHIAAVAAGDLLVTDTTANIKTSLNEAFVSSIAALTGNTAYRVVLSNPDGFPALPVATQPIYEVAHNRYQMGTVVQPFFRMLGVADFLNGSQVVHDFQKAAPGGQFVEALRNGQDARVPGTFTLFGYTVSTPYDTISQLVLGERFWFSPTSVGL